MKPMRAKARGAPQNSRVPQQASVGNPPETQVLKVEEENAPIASAGVDTL